MDTQELLSVSEELAEVTRLLADDDVTTSLNRYVSRLVRSVPGCDAAFISAASTSGIETVAGTWQPKGSEPIQLGPIGDAFAYREPRRLTDTRSDTRWPAFSAELRDDGYHSALVLPLTGTAEPNATLTLLSTTPSEFGEASFDVVQLFAAYAGAVLDNATLYSDCRSLVDNLRSSLRTRSTIGQAQGLLMVQRDLDTTGAFDVMRQASQRHNVKLRDLAADLVAAHEDGSFDELAGRFGLLAPGAA